jgi:hypothetical protein
MKYISLIIIICSTTLSSQTILNSEKVLSKIDSVLVVGIGLDGDFSKGNINLVQTNFSAQFGKKINKNVFRGVFNYSYTSENKEILSNDWTGQFRLNRFYNLNSIFIFIQGQNVKSLNLKSRYLFGGGYRMNLIKKSSNYLDFSLGFFNENETYNIGDHNLKVNNLRYSVSLLSSFTIFKNIISSNTLYYQVNTKTFSDYRIYYEPRLSYLINDNFELYLTLRARYHSTPYIDIKSNDYQSSFGLQFNL